MDFLESPRFPDNMAQHAIRHVCFLTEVVSLVSGHEQRNAVWSRPLHRYEISMSIQAQTELGGLLAFFEQVQGRFLPFRFKDWLDFNSSGQDKIAPTDQAVGRGDGVQCDFQLIKTTRLGELEQKRLIQKPVPGTVVVAMDGVPTQQVTVNTATGMLSFAEPPPEGAVITAGFEFDVPCRFDSDQLSMALQPPGLASFSLLLTEVRLPLLDFNKMNAPKMMTNTDK